MFKLKIILVDDREVFRIALRTYLTQTGHAEIIAEACNGKEFINILRTLKPDLVLMDIVMPEMDGIETTKKALSLYPDLKIIGLTTYEDKEFQTLMLQSGAIGFLTKNNIYEKLNDYLEQIKNNTL